MYKLFAAALLFLTSACTIASEYEIDSKGAHASINFKIKHLGYSWLVGRFNNFEGQFSFDGKNVVDSQISVTIDTGSIDSNHAERDKHLRSEDFLFTDKYPKSTFTSTRIEQVDNEIQVTGDFTLRGITRTIVITASKIGEGQDPWGRYRAGFTGSTVLSLKDFGIKYNLGPDAEEVYLDLHIEGVRK